jgi:hypothetical protein
VKHPVYIDKKNDRAATFIIRTVLIFYVKHCMFQPIAAITRHGCINGWWLNISPPRGCRTLMDGGGACVFDPPSYAGDGIATSRPSYARQVGIEKPDEEISTRKLCRRCNCFLCREY